MAWSRSDMRALRTETSSFAWRPLDDEPIFPNRFAWGREDFGLIGGFGAADGRFVPFRPSVPDDGEPAPVIDAGSPPGTPGRSAAAPGPAEAAGTSYSLTPASVTRTEGNTTITFTVTRSGSLPAETLYASTLFGTARSADGDYDGFVNKAVVFSSGEDEETFTVSLNEDSEIEGTEQFRVMIADDESDGPSQALDISDIFIEDDDTAAGTTYSLTPASVTRTEGATITFTVTRSGSLPAETLYASTLFGTASAPGDYVGLVNQAISFSSGETQETFTVQLNDDSLVENTEQFRVMIADDESDGPSQALDIADVFIEDNDTATGTTYSLTPSSITRTEGATITFTVTRSGSLPVETLYASTLFGTASAPGDYVGLVNQAISFSSGETQETFTVQLNDDSLVENTEQFRVMIADDEGDGSAQALAISNVSIEDNDTGSPPQGVDDYRDEPGDGSAPLGDLDVGGSVTGMIDPADADDDYGDKDVFAVNLTAGQVYDFRLEATGLPAGVFTIRDVSFVHLEISGSGQDVHELFQADRTGLFYVRVGSGGTPDDTGSYRLSVTVVDQGGAVPDDWADSPADAGSPGSLAPGGSQIGAIEAPGDLDYFTVNLTAGNIYHFSVVGEERSGTGAMDTVAISLRAPGDFDERLRTDDGSGRGSFDFQVTESGLYFVRVGAGSDSGDTGAYRVSVGTGRTPPPPPPPPPPPSESTPEASSEAVNRWIDDHVYEGTRAVINLAEVFNFLRETFSKGITPDGALKIVKHIDESLFVLGVIVDTAKAADRIIHPEYDQEKAIFVEISTLIASVGIAAGTLSTGLGGLAVGALWTWKGEEFFRTLSEKAYDTFLAQDDLSAQGLDFESLSTHLSQSVEESDLTIFNEQFYLGAYHEVVTLIAQGEFGSAYAHYLAVGVDLGYRPNPGNLLARSDLAIRLLNDDPQAIGNSAMFTMPFAQLAGDGVSPAEREVAKALGEAAGPAKGAALDAGLSALAHRKALDLAVNTQGDAVEAAGARDSAWALRWSDGADFGQLFTAELESLLGAGATDAYRLFVVPSASGSAEDVLAALKQQQGWSAGGFDTFGIAEVGGLWVVIVADRAPGVQVERPGTDGLSTISIYGSGEDEALYAGLRTGRLFGLSGNDTLIGGSGNDFLDGGTGADTMFGGLGNDSYVVDHRSDRVGEGAKAGGVDTVYSSIVYTLGDNIENLVLTGDAAIHGTGNGLANKLTGNAAGNRLDGGAGADVMKGGGGNDVYIVDDAGDRAVEDGAGGGIDLVKSSASFALGAYVENLTLTGSAAIDGTGNGRDNFIVGNDAANVLAGGLGQDYLLGGGGDDTVYGGAGRDILDGGAGDDRMQGGAGDDSYFVDSAKDQVFEAAGGGIDTIYAGASYTLGAGQHVEFLTTTDRNGTASLNLVGNGLANNIYGNAGANLLAGAGGDDVLDGGAGADTMYGGLGDDSYVVDHRADRAIEGGKAGGVDTVFSSVGYALGENIENLVLTGTASSAGTGNELANWIVGNGAGNRLDGGAGADVMKGGDGDDLYIVDHVGDAVIETSVSGGTDSVLSSVGFTLGARVENLTLTGTGAIHGLGNGRDNVITGNAAANLLAGALGRDTIFGGGGDDTLYGGGGADKLDGGEGRDRMQGGAGDDLYIVSQSGDTVIEGSGGGLDLVHSSVGFTLSAHVENLTLTGTAAVAGTGNGLANLLTGNAAANLLSGWRGRDTLIGGAGDDRLDGGTGADALYGGRGNDTFVVDHEGDRVFEGSAGGGVDLVESSVDFALGAHVENLKLTGTTAVAGQGNALANALTGNRADNVLQGWRGDDALQGLDGADTLIGGKGHDRLTGGAGVDRFVFDAPLDAANVDTILDFQPGKDAIVLENAVFKGLGAGALSAGALAIGAAAADANDRIVYDPATGALYYDPDGSGAVAQIQFATLANAPAILAASDFQVI